MTEDNGTQTKTGLSNILPLVIRLALTLLVRILERRLGKIIIGICLASLLFVGLSYVNGDDIKELFFSQQTRLERVEKLVTEESLLKTQK